MSALLPEADIDVFQQRKTPDGGPGGVVRNRRQAMTSPRRVA